MIVLKIKIFLVNKVNYDVFYRKELIGMITAKKRYQPGHSWTFWIIFIPTIGDIRVLLSGKKYIDVGMPQML